MNSSFGSSAPAMNIAQYVNYFGVSKGLALSTISLYIAGYVAGPLAWGPASEIYGRRIIFIISVSIYTLACLGCGFSEKIYQILILRFVAGCSGAASICISGAVIGDVFEADMRGIGVSIISLAPFAGVALSPVIGGWIEAHQISWKWIYWISAISSAFSLILVVLFFSETYHPTLLQKKTRKIRNVTGDNRYWASLDQKKTDLRSLMHNSFVKPFLMLFHEPLLFMITLYIWYLYMPFEMFPLVTKRVHHLSAVKSGVSFLALLVGGLIMAIIYLLYYTPKYRKQCALVAPEEVSPEIRLEIGKIGAIVFPLSIIMMGWTGNYLCVSVWFPILALGLMGASILSLFIAFYTYLIDSYLESCATAISINIVVRSLFGSLLLFDCTPLSPLPFVLQTKAAKNQQNSQIIQKVDQFPGFPSSKLCHINETFIDRNPLKAVA
ncbi:MFS general substrate transporter [Phakopsora pachyrhizi]|uniref:MFS general substrate transporter n=1 Tax=Phakopsora pachyrhizi TaxID=170000 RepID=A0AAV0ARY2_PHAPC|nr:MFS general substrate transporter [Phakopsora pachyrhizi]